MYKYIMQNQEVTSSIVVDDSLKYSKKEYSHPKYKLHQLYPLSGLQTQALDATGGQEIIFQLPVKTMNLSQCVLSYNMAPALAPAAPPNIYFAHKTPLSTIRQIQLYTQSGVYLCDLYYANKFLNTVYYAETSGAEFATNEDMNVTARRIAGIYTHPSNLQTPGAQAARAYTERIITDAAGALQVAGSAGCVSVPNIERMYVDAGTNATPNVLIRFPMKYLYNTIFSVDRDLFFGEVLQLRIVFDGRDSAYCRATAATDIGTGTNVLDRDITLSGISFFCAIEQDLNIANQIISKVQTSGLQVSIPYVYSYKTNLSSTSQSLSLRFNRAHGKKLRRIYHAPFHGADTSALAYTRDNLEGSKTVTSFYTLLNNDRLQEFNVNCVSAQDYMILRNKIKDSCLSSVDLYQHTWFWVDDFTSESPLHSKESQDLNLSSGIDLSSEQKWDIYMTTADPRALNHYNFAITEKELIIAPGTITVS